MGVMIILGGMAGAGIVALGYLQLEVAADVVAVQAAFYWPTIALGVLEVTTMIVLVLTVSEGRAAPDRGGRSWLQIARSTWGTDILRERSYVWLLSSRLCYLAMPGVITAYAVFVLERSFGLPPADAGPLLFLIGGLIAAGTALAVVPAAWLSDRVGRKRVIYISFGLAALGVSLLAAAPSVPMALAALVPIGLSAGAFLTVDWALMTDIIPKATTGRYMGISNVATATAGPLGLTIAGVVLAVVTAAGLPAVGGSDVDSALLGAAPRASIAVTLVFIALAALALTRVDERRRED
jgi:MFS family permease